MSVKAALVQYFSFKTDSSLSSESSINSMFDLSVASDLFTKQDVINIYKKILTDCVQRTHGMSKEQKRVMWDNCVKSSAPQGLVSLLAEAMQAKADLFLVYKETILRLATTDEQALIKADYEKSGTSSTGVYISFKNYCLTDFLMLYSLMEYYVLGSLNKSMNLAKGIQFKMNKLREGVGSIDSAQIVAAAKSMAEALSCGKNVLMDGEDSIETSKVEMDATEKAILFIDGKRAFTLGLPLAYINGQQQTGMGTTGEGDTKAVERGLTNFYVSVLEPSLIALFPGTDFSYKSQDFRMLTSGLEAIKTFELLSTQDYLSKEEQKTIIKKLFNIDDDSKN